MVEQWEFLDCATISIQYQTNGLATVSMTVVSTEPQPGVNPPRDFTQLSFGGINFKGFVTQLQSNVIPGSLPTVFEHQFTLIGIGCAEDCPRGA